MIQPSLQLNPSFFLVLSLWLCASVANSENEETLYDRKPRFTSRAVAATFSAREPEPDTRRRRAIPL
jgi:hypothetical protein